MHFSCNNKISTYVGTIKKCQCHTRTHCSNYHNYYSRTMKFVAYIMSNYGMHTHPYFIATCMLSLKALVNKRLIIVQIV